VSSGEIWEESGDNVRGNVHLIQGFQPMLFENDTEWTQPCLFFLCFASRESFDAGGLEAKFMDI
jgi:hypothetical protein